MEYGHTVELADGWYRVEEGHYRSDSPAGILTVSSQYLPREYDLDQFTRLVRYGLREDWWPGASLFEVMSVEDTKAGDQPATRIRYRVQMSPGYCVIDVAELVLVSQLLPGNPQGFRAFAWMCEHEVGQYGKERDAMLDSLRTFTKEAEYYTQFLSVNGIAVKAAGSVDPAAVEAGADIVAAMLSGRQDIARCMVRMRADLAITPKDELVTSLPEFERVVGTSDFTGRRLDSFEIRGLGAVPGHPVTAAAEEQLLGTLGPQHPYQPYRGLVAVHEFAHSIQNLCFTKDDHEEWDRFYEEAVRAGVYEGSHMMANVMEFFAVLSTGYFEVTDELGTGSDLAALKNRFPKVFEALEEIYGGAAVPEEYRTRLERQH